MTERVINAERIEQIISVFGSFDENIKRIEQAFDIHVTNRGTELKVQGDVEAADKGVRAIEALMSLASKGETIDEQKVRYLIGLINAGNDAKVGEMAKNVICVTRASPSRPKPWASRSISRPSPRIPSLWVSAPPVRVKRIWPLPWLWRRSGPRRSTALF